MSDIFKFNPLTGKLDLSEHIPQLTADPASPRQEDAWVLKTGGSGTSGSTVIGGGSIMGWVGLGSMPILDPGVITAGTGGTVSVSGGGMLLGWIGLGSTPIVQPGVATYGTGSAIAYQLSYRTKENTTIRVTLS